MTLPAAPPVFAYAIWMLGTLSAIPAESEEEQDERMKMVAAWIRQFLLFDDYKACHWAQAPTKGNAIRARLLGGDTE